MSLPRTLAKRGISILSVVFITLFAITFIAGATGLEERILVGKLNKLRGGYSMSLAAQVAAGDLDSDEVPRLLEAFYQDKLEEFGLDRPWWGRLLSTLLMVMTFDLGETGSHAEAGGFHRVSVWGAISDAVPNTLLLLLANMVISAPLGIMIGASRARKARDRGDTVTAMMSTISYALPGWLLGYMLTAVLLRAWYRGNLFYGGFISTGGYLAIGEVHPVFDFFYHWALPVTSLAIPSLGFWIYQSRSILINVAQEEYVTVAEAKGLSETRINRRYVLRVGLPTILTQVGLVIHSSIANSVPVEAIFGWHGLGFLLWRVVWSGDIATYGNAGLLLGIVYAYALVYAAIRFALEILYVVLDPRIRY
ncbi:MAG: ABC transporter permease [Candidatus Bathyarchaeota archaeon]|jgi:peptide/nickel transport system permease protein